VNLLQRHGAGIFCENWGLKGERSGCDTKLFRKHDGTYLGIIIGQMFKQLALKTGTTSSSSLSKQSSLSNLSCSEYEPLSLAASASAISYSLFPFDVFRFGAFFAFEKAPSIIAFLF